MKIVRPMFLCLILVLICVVALSACESKDGDDDDDAADDDAADGDDDAVDDDDDDDDLGPLEHVGWIMLDADPQNIEETLDRVLEFGVTDVQLSHELIMDIDELTEDPWRPELLNGIIDQAHELGLGATIWSHELARPPLLVCFDPEDSYWDERTMAYRDGLDLVPDADGVMLMFGSSDLELWYAPCFCQWCLDLEPLGNPLLDLLHSRPVDRIGFVTALVRQVVIAERGKSLRIRTFMHNPDELQWLGDALRAYPDLDVGVMTKDVPQDWEPYYPHNPLIGNVGERDQIVEFDLAGEYWGQSKIPFALPDYLQYRIRHAARMGCSGAAGRISRGSNSALGTPNEINVYAFSKLLADPDYSTDQIWSEWIEQTYGLDQGGTQSATLISALRRSFDIGRKMYYVKGFWALEKGSDVPDSCKSPGLLLGRAISLYDPDYQGWLDELFSPGEQTLSDIWQEGAESIELCARSLAELESIQTDLDPVVYADLHSRLEHQCLCTGVWQLVDDAVFRYQRYVRTFDAQQGRYLEGTLQQLAGLADQIEAEHGSISPGNPGRIRACVQDIRGLFPNSYEAEQFDQTALSLIEFDKGEDGLISVSWLSSNLGDSQVEFGFELPDYGWSTAVDPASTLEHEVELINPDPNQRLVFRVKTRDESGSLIVSSDYWVRPED
ncbi:MAG: hypothetical protein P9M14_14880 [Candidatus Alcyoniella australis]|nr:hypothetical protein [Candidatus Alcyoniella australis]